MNSMAVECLQPQEFWTGIVVQLMIPTFVFLCIIVWNLIRKN